MLQGGGIQERLLAPLYLDVNMDHRRSVFLAGSGRSGTTWVSEIINHRREYRLVFEPFDPERVSTCRNFRRKQYLRPDDAREEYLAPARKILSGGLRSLWADRLHRKFIARRRIVKDIRTNLLLGWMRANFPGMPIILLMRHPCAVAASKLALGWRDLLDGVMDQEELVEDHLRPFEREIRAAKTDFERHVFVWCIENYVPLKQLSPGDAHIVFYEELISSPETEIPRLFSFLGRSFDDRVYEALKHPSPMTRSGAIPENRMLDGWRGIVGDEQTKRAVQILGLFGLDGIYGEESRPNPEGAHALMGDPGAKIPGGLPERG